MTPRLLRALFFDKWSLSFDKMQVALVEALLFNTFLPAKKP